MDSYTLGLFANMYPSPQDITRGIFIKRMVDDLTDRGVTVKLAVKTSSSLSGYIPFLYQSARMARNPEIDIMQAEYIPHSSVVPAFFRRKKCPLVIKFHGDDARIFPFKNSWYLAVTRMMIRHSDYIITSSEELKTNLISIGAPPDKVTAVHTGVDTEFFCPVNKDSKKRELRLSHDFPVFLFVGRLHPWKGINEIIHVARICPDSQFVFIGPGETPNHPENCHFLGIKSPECVKDWLNAADCLLLPSYTEGFPTVIMEAFACNTPVIATAVGGCPEMVEPGKTGLLLPVRDIPALHDAIVWMGNHTDERIRMGERARSVAVEQFDHIRMTQKLMAIHKKLIEND
jgi:teichuronic acid biosynthesis glycosyltransferase TuaC